MVQAGTGPLGAAAHRAADIIGIMCRGLAHTAVEQTLQFDPRKEPGCRRSQK